MNRCEGINIRSAELTEFEFTDEGSNGFTFEGRASTVEVPYTVRDAYGEFVETMGRGAFTKTLSDGGDVGFFVNHNQLNPPLATRAAGTLELTADPHLDVRAHLDPARPDVQVLKSAVDRREMPQMSIGFRVPKNRDTWNDDMTERIVHEVNLVEVSSVWHGSNTETTAAMRSLNMLPTLSAFSLDEILDELRSRGHEVDFEPFDELVEQHSSNVAAMLLDLHRRRPAFCG